MPFRQTLFSVIVALGLLILIIELVRRRRLREEYSWLWLLVGVSVLLVVIWYDLLVWLTNLIGAVLPTTTLFIMAILYLVMIALHFSVRVSTLENRVKELAQSHALIEGATRSILAKGAQTAGPRAPEGERPPHDNFSTTGEVT